MLSPSRTYFIAFTAAISGLLFGYDAGVISGAILFIKQTFPVANSDIGLIVSAVPIGALCSALFIGKISDAIGRKKVLLATAVLFILGAVCCGLANNIDHLIVGRLLMGFAVGMSSSSAPLYIAEMAQKKNRGRLVTLFLISVNGGLFAAYAVNYLFAATGAWRHMLALGALPGIILFLCALRLPESPRWLVLRGKAQAAAKILERLYGKTQAQEEMLQIKAVAEQQRCTLKMMFQRRYDKVLLLGIIVSIFTQAIGINAIIYYAPTIFQKTGFHEATASILATMGIGLTVTLAAVAAALFIDKAGRRNLLLFGLAGIILSLAVITYAFAFIQDAQTLGWAVLLGSICFVACQGMSVGPACFLIPSEIFPIQIRGSAMGISIAFNWLTNSIVAFLFPIVLDSYGASHSFGMFLAISLIGWVLFYVYLPETRGVSLEHIELNINKGLRLRNLGVSN